jgi:protein gp37
MASKTSIEWTDYNWNFLRGCSRVSEGCRNCYAEKIAGRFSGEGMAYAGLAKMVNHEARWTGEIKFYEDVLLEPLKWKKPRRVFVNSMSDLFHEKVTDEMLDKAFAVMALTPQHTYQILTKRPERMKEYFRPGRQNDVVKAVCSYLDSRDKGKRGGLSSKIQWLAQYDGEWPPQNVWLGVSCEDQKTADERIPLLLETPAAIRWISAEPLLGPIDLTQLPTGHWAYGKVDVMSGYLCGDEPDAMTDFEADPAGWIRKPPSEWERGPHKLDWVVVGGESGPGARSCDISWIRWIVEQCKAAGVPAFVKQFGARPFMGVKGFGPVIKNRKGGDPSEWPEDLQIREFPDRSGQQGSAASPFEPCVN